MMKNKIKLLILLLILLNSCQTLKDGLTGKKRNNSDEFLVEKKNPLELPPDFDKLPVPKKKDGDNNQSEKIDEEIENLFSITEENASQDNETNLNQSAEDFVLKKIDNN